MSIDLNNLDLNAFDFNQIEKQTGVNPFEQDKKSYVDERFYTLTKDKDMKGQAIIAFLPDMKFHTLIQMYKINTTITKQTIDATTKEPKTQKRYKSIWSPKSIGLADPFHETYISMWEKDSDTARKYKPQKRFIANIKIIKDPANKDNEGKIFLYEFSQSMANKLMEALNPSETDIQMGVTRKEIFNPLKGWVFVLKCQKGTNGIVTYDSSQFQFLGDGKSIYGDLANFDAVKAKCAEDLRKTYDLDEFKDPANFKSYQELQNDLYYVSYGEFGVPAQGETPNINIEKHATVEPKAEVKDSQEVQVAPVQTVQAVSQPAPQPQTTAKSEFDDLLNSLS